MFTPMFKKLDSESELSIGFWRASTEWDRITYLLRRARQLLVEEGWTQRTYRDGRGRCAFGAVREVAGSQRDLTEMCRRLVRASDCGSLSALMWDSTQIYSYNDITLKTTDEALAWFDRAIAG